MPGKRITDHQMTKYKRFRKQFSQEAAAAKVGIGVRSARRLERRTQLPSQREPRHWRTRADALLAVWDSEIKPLLRAAPGLTAVSLLEEMQRRYPGRFAPGL